MSVVAISSVVAADEMLRMSKMFSPNAWIDAYKGGTFDVLTITSKRIKLQSRADSQIAENFMSFF